MKFHAHHVLASLTALALAPILASAATQTFQCGMNHYIRAGGSEIVTGTITVRNTDLTHTATIQRLTIRDGNGNVLHDSGPLTPLPLPLNTDFPNTAPLGKDITHVPPGGAVYLRSNHLWGNNGLPSGAAGNEAGQLMSASVVVTKEGQKSALAVHATQRLRTRAAGSTPGSFIETDTRASSTLACDAQP